MSIRFSPGCECCGCCEISAVSAVPATPGAGYKIGDTITAGGVVLVVDAVGLFSGAVVVVSIINPGSFAPTAIPANPVAQSSTSGMGAGASFNFRWSQCCPCGHGPDTAGGCSVIHIVIGNCDTMLVSQPRSSGGECVWSGTCNGQTVTLSYCQTTNTWTLIDANGNKSTLVGNGTTPQCPPFTIGQATVSNPPASLTSPTFQATVTLANTYWFCFGDITEGGGFSVTSGGFCDTPFDLSGTVVLQPNGNEWFGLARKTISGQCYDLCQFGVALDSNCQPGSTQPNNCFGDGTKCGTSFHRDFTFELDIDLRITSIPCPCDPDCQISWQATIGFGVNGILYCQLFGTATSTYTPGQPIAVPNNWNQAPHPVGDPALCWNCPQPLKLNFGMFAFQ